MTNHNDWWNDDAETQPQQTGAKPLMAGEFDVKVYDINYTAGFAFCYIRDPKTNDRKVNADGTASIAAVHIEKIHNGTRHTLRKGAKFRVVLSRANKEGSSFDFFGHPVAG